MTKNRVAESEGCLVDFFAKDQLQKLATGSTAFQRFYSIVEQDIAKKLSMLKIKGGGKVD